MLDTIPDYARMARLVFAHTTPTNARLRKEIADRGTVIMASILTGDRKADPGLEDFDQLAKWQEKLQGFNPERELADLAQSEIRFIIPGDDEWPEQLDELTFPPFGLFVGGHKTIPDMEKMIAVVGSRDATAYGTSITSDWSATLAGKGYTVVSGGAYGIDAAAHRGALSHGILTDQVPTIAVLAGGLDRFYPTGNADLLRQVMEHGLVITETPLGASPSRTRFLDRNRIIAALCTSTVVVEARWRSGSLSTARHAQLLGRRIGGVPGSVYSSNSAGVHQLLRDGVAECITDPNEVINLKHIHLEK